LTTGQGLAISIGLAVVFVAAGLGVCWPATTRAALLLSVIVGVAIWVLGENFGGVLTGQGTDPSTGLVLVLLAVAFWPRQRRPADAISHDQGNAPVMAQEEMA
jgi:cytochrome c biogenesis protein CcdA